MRALLLSSLVAAAVAAAAGSADAQRRPSTLADYWRALACTVQRGDSVGPPGRGRLRNGVLFPPADPFDNLFWWDFRSERADRGRATHWGNCRMVRAVLLAIARYRRLHADAPPVAVGDLGRRFGGEIDGHATHENGLQVDLYLPRLDRERRAPATVAQVDQRLTRGLARQLLRAGARELLIGPGLRAVPTGPRVRRVAGHDDHVHAFF